MLVFETKIFVAFSRKERFFTGEFQFRRHRFCQGEDFGFFVGIIDGNPQIQRGHQRHIRANQLTSKCQPVLPQKFVVGSTGGRSFDEENASRNFVQLVVETRDERRIFLLDRFQWQRIFHVQTDFSAKMKRRKRTFVRFHLLVWNAVQHVRQRFDEEFRHQRTFSLVTGKKFAERFSELIQIAGRRWRSRRGWRSDDGSWGRGWRTLNVGRIPKKIRHDRRETNALEHQTDFSCIAQLFVTRIRDELNDLLIKIVQFAHASRISCE